MNQWTMPYLGEEDYIFISYSHKDSEEVLKVIAYLSKQGIRIWHYQEGTLAGKEWDENIASHIKNCSGFIAFISENYLSSSNCSDEMNYARTIEQERIFVFLEPVTMPPGKKLRMGTIQAIHQYAYPDNPVETVGNKLLQSPMLRKICSPDADEVTGQVPEFCTCFERILHPGAIMWRNGECCSSFNESESMAEEISPIKTLSGNQEVLKYWAWYAKQNDIYRFYQWTDLKKGNIAVVNIVSFDNQCDVYACLMAYSKKDGVELRSERVSLSGNWWKTISLFIDDDKYDCINLELTINRDSQWNGYWDGMDGFIDDFKIVK